MRCCVYGVRAVQLREKDLLSKELLQVAKKLRRVTRKNSSQLLINDRIDIALLSEADGVHSPVSGAAPSQIKMFNKYFLTGKSVHSLKSAVKAEMDGYDYIIFGPVFKPNSKITSAKPEGLSKLKEICSTVNIPVFAIGGINPKRANQCVKMGAYGVAVIGSIFHSELLNKTIIEFENALGGL